MINEGLENQEKPSLEKGRLRLPQSTCATGHHWHSGTGVISGLPSTPAFILANARSAIAWRVWRVALAM
jgi:hypothetical protein